MNASRTRVLAVGHARRALVGLVRDDGTIVVDQVADLDDALGRVLAERYDCLVVDLETPRADPTEVVAAVRRADARVAVVVVAGPEDDAVTIDAVTAGAEGHLVAGHLDATVVRRVLRSAVARKRAEGALVHRAMFDPVTGLMNRVGLDELLPTSLHRADRRGTRIGVIFVDFTGLESLDDRADSVADRALRTIADRLQDVARDSDLIARVGSSAFVVVCEDLSVDRSVRHLATRLEESLAEPVPVPGGSPANLVATLRFASADGTTAPAELLRRSDRETTDPSGWFRR